MGLRFRKSITILPGVKLNLGKTGASVSLGVKGLHANIHTSGKVTGTASLPGTGISYQKSKNIKTVIKDLKKRREAKAEAKAAEAAALAAEEEAAALPAEEPSAALPAAAAAAAVAAAPVAAPEAAEDLTDEQVAEMAAAFRPSQLTDEALRSIHKAFDEPVDWAEFAQHETPPYAGYSAEKWAYFHENAPAVLAGDIDTYLQVIYEVGPLDDLLEFGGQFQFGTDRASLMEVEFTVNEETLEEQRMQKNVVQFYDLLQDYVCSTCIRIARDILALLPVAEVVVHAVLAGDTVVSVRFDRKTMDTIKFGWVDPSDVLDRFEHNMAFAQGKGFAAVERIDTGD